MKRSLSLVALSLAICLICWFIIILVAAYFGLPANHHPGRALIGVVEVDYQAWTCTGGLVEFHDAMIGNVDEPADHYDSWLSPIPCSKIQDYVQ